MITDLISAMDLTLRNSSAAPPAIASSSEILLSAQHSSSSDTRKTSAANNDCDNVGDEICSSLFFSASRRSSRSSFTHGYSLLIEIMCKLTNFVDFIS